MKLHLTGHYVQLHRREDDWDALWDLAVNESNSLKRANVSVKLGNTVAIGRPMDVAPRLADTVRRANPCCITNCPATGFD